MRLSRFAFAASLAWLGLGLAACSNSGGSSGSGGAAGASASANSTAGAASPTAAAGFRMRSGDYNDNDSASIEKRFATANPLYDKKGYKRATDTAKQFAGANHEFQGGNKEFKTDLYQKKSFWGDKEYAKKVYGGNTDGSRFMKDSQFGAKTANEGGVAAHDAGKQYATNNYGGATKAAREAGRSGVDRKSDAEADYRRRVSNEFAESPVLDWKQQREMSIQETRKLLGRD